MNTFIMCVTDLKSSERACINSSERHEKSAWFVGKLRAQTFLVANRAEIVAGSQNSLVVVKLRPSSKSAAG